MQSSLVVKSGSKRHTIDLTDNHIRSLKASRDWRAMIRFSTVLAAILGVLLVALSVGTFLGYQSSKTAVEKHVSVWEEEIAKNLLLKGDVTLFEKVKAQIPDVARDVSAVLTTSPENSPSCALVQTVPITLYGTPSGHLYVCRSQPGVLQAGLQSPVFILLMSVGLLFVFWIDRRGELEAARLQAANKTAEALEQLAKQVAHDIRSPVGALNVINESLISMAKKDQGDEFKAISPHLDLLKGATARITKIADDLLSNPHPGDLAKHAVQPRISPAVVASTVQSIVHEKRLQTKASALELRISRPNEISKSTTTDDSHLVDSDLGRVLSNLIQNALEAPRAEGVLQAVVVDLNLEASGLEIRIKDNGLGLDDEFSTRLGRRGFSFGKRRGNGLGVAHARDWVHARGGRLVYESTRNQGTEVRLNLPR